MMDTRGVALHFKLGGMNVQLLHAELDQLEAKCNVDLGRLADDNPDRAEEYYPQFDELIRSEAREMAQHYELFYCLERSIRTLIGDTLAATDSAEWWDKGRIPQAIHDEVARRVERDVESAVTLRSTEPIDFTTFGELGEIIKTNWDLFGSLLNSRRAVEEVMANLNVLRGPIAHCSPLAQDEVLRLQLSLRDWFRLME